MRGIHLTRLRAKLPGYAHWSIGKKNLMGHLLFLVLPLFLFFALITQYTLAHWQQSSQDALQATGGAIAEMIESSIDASLRNYLRAVAESQRKQVENAQQKTASMDEARLKQSLLAGFRNQKIGPSGFLFCMDSSGTLLSHPVAEWIGKNVLQEENYRDLWPLIRQQLVTKQGYSEYSWQNPLENGPHPKAVYLVYYAPYDWIIGAVCNRDNVERFLDFADLEQRMANVHFGAAASYAFLLNDTGHLLIHPYKKETRQLENYAGKLKAIANKALASPTHMVRTAWQDVAESGTEERLFYCRHLPRFNLTMGVSVDASDTDAWFNSTRLTLLFLILSAASVAVALVFFLSRVLPWSQDQCATTAAAASPAMAPDHHSDPFLGEKKCEEHGKSLQALNDKLTAEGQRRKSAETFLKIYRKIFDNATEGIVVTDHTGRILAVNEAFTAITGYLQAEAIGQNPRILKSGQHDTEFYRTMWSQLQEQRTWEGEIWNKKKDGTIYPEWLTINVIKDDEGGAQYYCATFYEIGELKRREKQITYMAYHDILTRLPNRAYLENRLAKILHRQKEAGETGKVALLHIDLDNFKNVNDVFGHKHGDDLLVQVCQRIATILSADNMLCRIGGDEFVLLIDNIDNESMIYLTIGRIQAMLKQPFLLDFKKIYINASIGVAVAPDDADSAPDLIRSADMAMHKAKKDGKNRYILFSKEMHHELYEKFRIENGIRYGLLNREFVVYYQPKVNIDTRTTVSLEALIRWEKGHQLISPGAFIPVAEESSLIDDLCLFVLEETCAFYRLMHKEGVAVPISVNISPRQFLNLDFVDIVEDLLGRYQVEPRFIEFEITETTAMQDVEYTLTIMHRLRNLGILFSIDDFGTGYSSLGYLSKMPVSTLKIDKQFVDDLQANSGIVATIISICQHMHLNVVAEGVETEGQLLALDQMGCQEAQGYFFSRPISGDNMLHYLHVERGSNEAQSAAPASL